MTYDPSLKGLLAQCKTDWGNASTNRKNIVPYGIKPFDLALYGLDIVNGEMILVMGQEKHRKTTVVANILVNFMTYDKLETKPFTVIDTLESGMSPKRYRDTLVAIMASRVLIEQGHEVGKACPVCRTPKCKQLLLTPDYFRFNTWSSEQTAAIKTAQEIMEWWPVHIYGANEEEGNTRSLDGSINNTKSRWRKLIEERDAKIFIADHIQQYSFSNSGTYPTDYEKQIRGVAAIGDVVAQHHIVALVLSQVSLGSIKDLKDGGQLNAAGGRKGQQEAVVTFSTFYKPGSGQVKIAIEESRKSGAFYIYQPIDDISGTFYGDPIVPSALK